MPATVNLQANWSPWIALLYGLSLALLAYFFVGPGQELAWDNGAHHLPLSFEAARQWFAGELPSWNPFLWSGSPLLADPQAMVFYPPAVFSHALTREDPLLSMRLLCAAHVAIAVIGTALFMREQKFSCAASLLAATAFALNPWAVRSLLGFVNIYSGASWLPWQLLVFQKLLNAPTPSRWLPAAALTAALGWLAGYPQIWIFSAIFACVSCLGLAPRGQILRRAWLAPLAYLLALSLVAFQVLPSVALWSNSHRTQALEVMTLPFWPMRELPGILVPGLITGVSPVPSFLNLAHLGFVTAALALVSLVRLDRLRLVLLILGVLGAMLSMGPEGGLSEIVQRLPVLGLFRGPFLYFLWVTMAVAWLGAAGLDDILRQPRRWHAMALGAIAALALVGYATHRPAHDVVPEHTLQQAASFAIPAAAIVGLLFLAGRKFVGLAGAAAVFGVAGGLLLEAYSLLSPSPAGLTRYARPPNPAVWNVLPLLDEGESRDPAERWRSHWSLPILAPRHWGNDLRGAVGSFWGIELSTGYAALVDPAYVDAIGYWSTGNMKDHSVLRPDNAVLDVLSTPYVFVAAFDHNRRLGTEAEQNFWHQLNHSLAVVVRPSVLPRARSVRQVERVATRDEAIARTQVAGGIARERAWIDEEFATADSPDAGPADPCEIESQRLAPGLIEAKSECEGPGFLVFSERADPGWKAELNEEPRALYRAYGLVLGLEVPGGSSRIRLTYEPPGFWPGVAVAAATCLLLGVLALWRPRNRRLPRENR